MAGRYLDEVRARQPAGPYHLGGWSMGGAIAVEMARRLRESGEETAVHCGLNCASGVSRGTRRSTRINRGWRVVTE